MVLAGQAHGRSLLLVKRGAAAFYSTCTHIQWAISAGAPVALLLSPQRHICPAPSIDRSSHAAHSSVPAALWRDKRLLH